MFFVVWYYLSNSSIDVKNVIFVLEKDIKWNTMRTKNIILLAVIACIGVVAFFFACKYSYESKLSALKEEAKEAFIKAFNQELKSRNVEE